MVGTAAVFTLPPVVTDVAGAMKAFGHALKAETNSNLESTTNSDLGTLSRKLAPAFQESLIERANLSLDEFRKGKSDYRR